MFRRALLTPLLAASLFALPALADALPPTGGLQVLPTRVVFEGRERAAAITLVNNGQKSQTYRLSFVEMKMNEDGKLEEVPSGVAVVHSAAQYIRFSPRQVTLDPKTTQTVRLQLRLPAELERGEYRSHLLLRAIPDVDDAISAASPEAKLQIKLVPVYGVSLPVIFRVGEPTAQLSLSDVRLTRDEAKSTQSLELKLNRAGDRSGYGDLVATFVPDQGAPVELTHQKGIGIYVPNAFRQMRVALPKTLQLGRGTVRVKFTDPAGGTLASAELPVR